MSFLEGLGEVLSAISEASTEYYTHKREMEEKRKTLIAEIEKFNKEAATYSIEKIIINDSNNDTKEKSVTNDNLTIIDGYRFTTDACKFLRNNGYTQAGDDKHYMKGNKLATVKTDYSKNYPVYIEIVEVNI